MRRYPKTQRPPLSHSISWHPNRYSTNSSTSNQQNSNHYLPIHSIKSPYQHYPSQSSKYKENNPQPDLQKVKTSEELSKLTFYQLAKYYQNNINSRNLQLSLQCYQKAFKGNEKKDSCIKDMAGVLHQMGRTEQAVEFLTANLSVYKGDLIKYHNLIDNFKKQIEAPSGKNMNRFILILNLPRESMQQDYKNLFLNSSRITSVKIYSDLCFTTLATDSDIPYGLLQFPSYSSAKKTMQSFLFSQNPYIQPYWVNINRLIICEIRKGEDDPFELNTCYFGSNQGFDKFMNIVDSPPQGFEEECKEVMLFTEGEIKKKDIRRIWGKGEEVFTPMVLKRIEFENRVKLEMIRSRKGMRDRK